MTLDVETDGLRTVASDLGDASTALSEIGGNVGSIGDLADGNAQAGLEALTVAWGVALEVLSEDVSFLSDQVGNAADRYDTTDCSLANHCRGNVG